MKAGLLAGRQAADTGPEFTDDFNRAGPGIGADWNQSEVGAGALVLLGNRLATGTSSTVNFARVTTAMSSVDMYAQCEFQNVDAGEAVGIIIRSANNLSPGNYYIAQYDPTNKWRIRRVVSGTATTLASDTTTIVSSPNVYRFEVEGADLRVKLNDTTFLSTTDGSPINTGNYVGVRLDMAGAVTYIENFEASSL